METGRTSSRRKKNNNRSNKRMGRSPKRFTRPFFRGRHQCARFYYRSRDDYFFRRNWFNFKFHRFPRASNLRLHSGAQSPSAVLRHQNVHSSRQHSEKRPEKRSTPVPNKTTSSTPERSRSSSVASERPSISFTVKQEDDTTSVRECLSSVKRAAARSRAIQKKRDEIEEVYRQDCDTFCVVVRMLVAKDPSLERTIQTSLRENLHEIGLRCLEAMEHFINEYDSREDGTPSQAQLQ